VILENGTVRTLDPSLPRAAALAIAGERVAGGVGTHETALASPERVDLGGRCLVPGFSDAHVHFPTWSLAQHQVRLEGAEGLDEALARVASAVDEVPEGRWLRGLGWRSGDWAPPVEPTKEALDAVTGEVPVALMSKDYHSLWVNSAALARVEGDLQVPGGVVERDEQGEPTGVLREECAWHFRDTYARPTEDDMVEACREGIRIANARGVTAIHDKDGWLGALRVFERLRAEEALTLRVWQSLPYEHIDRLAETGVTSGLGDDLLRVGYIKAFLDGTLGSRTALLLDGSGVEIVGYEEFVDIVARSARAGFPVAVHAIGDLANRRALDAFEATRDEWAPRGLRQRIEHAQLLAAEDVGRFAELGVAASVQFSHAPSDRDIADRFWEGRTDGAYAFRSLLDSGALVANGSDAPVEELDPLLGIRAGVTRTLDQREAWHGEQRVTIEQALHATCVAPATSPISSSSTGIRSSARQRSLPRSRSSPPCSAAAGCTTRRPGSAFRPPEGAGLQ
jgi:predicted amidohydrolase YtcJ